jgi:hypothetical protein
VTRAIAILAALLVAAAPAGARPRPAAKKGPAKAKVRASAATPRSKGAKHARAAARGWRARPSQAADVAPGRPPHEGAPVEPAGVPAEWLAPATPPPPPAGEAPAPAPLCDPSPWLGVNAEDRNGTFRFRLTRTCVPAGTVLFQFRNNDLADHNLWAEGVLPARAPRRIVDQTPGETTVQASAQMDAGEWRLYCSFAGHETMSRTIDVTS